jgi:hypothetical protein
MGTGETKWGEDSVHHWGTLGAMLGPTSGDGTRLKTGDSAGYTTQEALGATGAAWAEARGVTLGTTRRITGSCTWKSARAGTGSVLGVSLWATHSDNTRRPLGPLDGRHKTSWGVH